MANIILSFVQEGSSIVRPPFFDGSNYAYWKKRMQIFLCSKDLEEWKTIKKGYIFSENEGIIIEIEDTNNTQAKLYSQNCKAMNSLICALSQNEFNKISSCQTAKEIWDRLESMHEGTSLVKESRISI